MSTRRASRIVAWGLLSVPLAVAVYLGGIPPAFAWDSEPLQGSVDAVDAYGGDPFVSDPASNGSEEATSADAVVTFSHDAALSPGPSSSFAALSDPTGFTLPANVSGAAGLSQLMVSTEADVQVQNKSGTVIGVQSQASFWSAVATGSVSYQRVLYDPLRNRWLSAALERTGNSTWLLIAASRSSDAMDQWTFYSVDLDPADNSYGSVPSLGFNSAAIVAQVNMFNPSTHEFVRSQVYAFDKDDAYAGASALYQVFSPDPEDWGGSQIPAITYDDYGSELLVQMWNGNSNGSGYLRLWALGGGPVGSANLAPGPLVGPLAPWAIAGVIAPQLGSSTQFLLSDAHLMSVVYRNGKVWAAHTVFLPTSAPTRSAIQWAEIVPSNGVILQLGRIDDSNGVSPHMFYAFPSIAVNASDDVLLGYSGFSSQQYISANYSFRRASDPAGTMQDERVLKAGEAAYDPPFWGNYSNTTVDPSNDHALWTIQEYAGTPSGGLSRWGTWWGWVFPPLVTGPTPTPTPTVTPTHTATVTETPNATATATPGCGLAPEAGCRTPIVSGKATITLLDKPDDGKDSLSWSWSKGSATTKSDFGDPLTTTAYDLCIYDANPTLVLAASIPPGGLCGKKPCWKAMKNGFQYKSKFAVPDGIQQLVLTGGVGGKAKIVAKGKGVNLDMPALPLVAPVRVQLRNAIGVCWEATYSVPSKNDAVQFKAKADVPPPTGAATPLATSTPASTRTTTPTPARTPTPALTVAPTTEYHVWGGWNYDEYLGYFSCTFCTDYGSDSINNRYGSHGSSYSSTSIRNRYGSYGSPYSSTSACNPYASNPPRVYNWNATIYYGELTVNQYRLDAIDDLLPWLTGDVCAD